MKVKIIDYSKRRGKKSVAILIINFKSTALLSRCLEGKSSWKAVYLKTEDIETATRAANFRIHPAPERVCLKQKLEYLKRERLNLYLDIPPPQLNY